MKCRNISYDKHALKRMIDNQSNGSLKDAKKETEKYGEILRQQELPYHSFYADNIQHLTKDEYLAKDLKEVRFFELND